MLPARQGCASSSWHLLEILLDHWSGINSCICTCVGICVQKTCWKSNSFCWVVYRSVWMAKGDHANNASGPVAWLKAWSCINRIPLNETVVAAANAFFFCKPGIWVLLQSSLRSWIVSSLRSMWIRAQQPMASRLGLAWKEIFICPAKHICLRMHHLTASFINCHLWSEGDRAMVIKPAICERLLTPGVDDGCIWYLNGCRLYLNTWKLFLFCLYNMKHTGVLIQQDNAESVDRYWILCRHPYSGCALD